MGYAFTKDPAGGTKITNANVVMYWNGPVFIQPAFNYDITISCGGVTLNLHLSDIDTIAGQPPAATAGAVIEQLITVFPDALAEAQQAAAGAVQKTGDTMTGALKIIGATPVTKIVLAMHDPGTQQNAPTALGVASSYLQIGSGEWGSNSYRLIELGYKAADANNAPAFIGYQETSTTSNTRGDLIFGTRPNNNNIAPSVVARINSAGDTLLSGNLNVQGAISSAANTNPASVTNSGVALIGAANFGEISLFDSTRTAGNRCADEIFFEGAHQFRFKNDAGNAAIAWLSATGGQVSGILSIASNSGSGAWTHTGNKVVIGTLEATVNSGNSVKLSGSASGGVPTISTEGVNPNISINISPKGGGGVILTNLSGTGIRNVVTDAAGALAAQAVAGTTAERPAGLTAANAGQQYFDTTLGKPVWWKGGEWVDATGTTA